MEIATIGIASSLGVPMKEILDGMDATPKGKQGQQEIGEYCKGQFIDECRGCFGEQALFLACRTCPD